MSTSQFIPDAKVDAERVMQAKRRKTVEEANPELVEKLKTQLRDLQGIEKDLVAAGFTLRHVTVLTAQLDMELRREAILKEKK